MSGGFGRILNQLPDSPFSRALRRILAVELSGVLAMTQSTVLAWLA
jgi:hypothetical protein